MPLPATACGVSSQPWESRGAAGAPMTTHSLRLCVGIRPTALPSFPMPSPATTCRASSQPATRGHAELRWRRSPHTLCAFAPLRAHPPRGTLSLSDAHAGNSMRSVVPARDRRVTRSSGGAVHDALSAPSPARSLYAPSPVRLVGSAEVRMGMARHGAANFRPSEVMVGSTSALAVARECMSATCRGLSAFCGQPSCSPPADGPVEGADPEVHPTMTYLGRKFTTG